MTLAFSTLTAQDKAIVNLHIIEDEKQADIQLPIKEVDTYLKELLSHYHDLGYWRANFHYESFSQNDSLMAIATLHKGEITILKEVLFQGELDYKPSYLSRYFMQSNSHISADKIGDAEAYFNRGPMGTISQREIFKSKDKAFLLSYHYRPEPSIFIDAMLGYKSSTANDSSNWVGLIKFKTNQIGGYPRTFSLEWEKLNAQREKLEIQYTEPWVFSSKLSIELSYLQEMVNGDYLKASRSVNGIYPINWNQEVALQYDYLSTFYTPSGQEKYPNQQDAQLHALGFSYYSYRDYFHNINVTTRLHVADKYVRENEEHIVKFNGDLAITLGLGKHFQYYGKEYGLYQYLDVDNPLHTEYVGGIRTLRGHYEGQYRVSAVGISQNELRIVKGESQLFLLYDVAQLHLIDEVSNVSGYGFGFRIPSGHQKIEVVLATNPSLGWQNTLLHLSYGGLDH